MALSDYTQEELIDLLKRYALFVYDESGTTFLDVWRLEEDPGAALTKKEVADIRYRLMYEDIRPKPPKLSGTHHKTTTVLLASIPDEYGDPSL